MPTPFRSLDFIYSPSDDVARDVQYFSDVLGGELVFAIEAMGTRVAMIRLAESPPALVFADHVDGTVPILVYRVDDLESAMTELTGRGWQPRRQLELPSGPACSFVAPGGQRVAIYEPTRSFVVEGFAGRRDFG